MLKIEDKTIADAIGGEFDLINILLCVPPLFVAIAMSLYGFQENNLGLLVTGLIQFSMPAAGLIITRNNLLKTPYPFYYSAFAYVGAHLLILVPDLMTGSSMAIMSVPSDAYLSVALGDTSVPVTAMINNYLAPRGENMAIIGLSILLLLGIERVTESKLIQAAVTVIPGSVVFALLHGTRSTGFFFFVGLLMALWIILVAGDELGIEFATELGLGAYALTVGFHQANNISASGGVLHYYNNLLSASEPVIYISYMIILLDALIVGYVVYKTLEIAPEKLSG